jgi:hypothetical protein
MLKLKENKKALEGQLAELLTLQKQRDKFIKENDSIKEQISRVKGAIQYVNQLMSSK